jgi:hypothetical protein
MSQTARAPSPLWMARLAGGLWLLVIAAGVFAEVFVRSTLVVSRDAAASSANILASEQLFRLGFVADLVSAGAYVATSFLLYDLLKPVNRSISLFAALLGLAGAVIMTANLANLLGALSYLKGGGFLTVFEAGELQAFAMQSLRNHSLGYNISMVVFAAHILLLGYLILRSTFLPRILGLLLVIEWLSAWINGLLIFTAPSYAAQLYPYILLPGLVAEGALALWLVAVGVNAPAWREQAGGHPCCAVEPLEGGG